MALKPLLGGRLGALVLIEALLAAGCAKKDEAPRRTQPWLANASASNSSVRTQDSAPMRFRFLPESRIRFAMAARKGTLQGEVPLAHGVLELSTNGASAEVVADLLGVSVDSTTLPTGPGLADGPRDRATVSETAREWLELGARVSDERRRPFTQARFHLTSLDPPELSQDEVAKVVLGGERMREWRVGVVGTLLVHGFRAPVRAQLSARLDAPPASSQAPRLTIRSRSPLVVSLTAHGVTARDAFGTPLPLVAKQLEDAVGKEAKVELELYAELVIQR